MGETVGFDDVLLDQIIFDAKRETLQLSRSVASLDETIRRVFSKGWEWVNLRWDWYSNNSPATVLERYRRVIGDKIEARLPADLKADVFRKGRRRGRTKCPKADCEKAHQKGLEKGFEEGYQAAMREVELQKEKERRGWSDADVQRERERSAFLDMTDKE